MDGGGVWKRVRFVTACLLSNHFYQPDIKLDDMEVKPRILLSTPQDMRLPLRWIAILHGYARCGATSNPFTACNNEM